MLLGKVNIGFIYEHQTFEKVDKFSNTVKGKEGWGLANDGEKLFKK